MKKIIASLLGSAALLTVPVYAQPIKCPLQSGDTIYDIARKYGIPIDHILSENPQLKSNPQKVKPGQSVNVPNPTDIKKLESEVVRLVNVQRSQKGLMMLKENYELSKVARLKSQDMINKNYFSHTSPTYGSPFDMMKQFGIPFIAAGENIAMGQRTPQEVMNAWMNSPGHRANILSPVYTQIGVGYAKDKNGRIYWTQQFIKQGY